MPPQFPNSNRSGRANTDMLISSNVKIRNPNIEIRNKYRISKIPNRPVNSNNENAKPYDLEERTAVFAEQSRSFVKRLPRTIGISRMQSNSSAPQVLLAQITSRQTNRSERRIL